MELELSYFYALAVILYTRVLTLIRLCKEIFTCYIYLALNYTIISYFVISFYYNNLFISSVIRAKVNPVSDLCIK